jgi:hypothetical protein
MRLLTSFQFEHFTSSSVGVALTLYANDGPLITHTNSDGTTSQLARPGTTLYRAEFGTFGGLAVSEVFVPIELPDTFTWTVTFRGIAPGESAGLPVYDPPTVGWSSPDFWQKIDGVWDTYPLSQPAGPANFAVRVITGPKPITIGKNPNGGLTITVATKPSPQFVQRATSLSGPWLDWQTAPSNSQADETVGFTDTISGTAGFYRMPVAIAADASQR